MKNKRALAYLMGLGLSSSVVALDNDAIGKASAEAAPQESLELSAEDAKKLEELFNNPEFLKELEEEVKKYEELERQEAANQALSEAAAPVAVSEEVVVAQDVLPAGELDASLGQETAPVAAPQQTWWQWFTGLFGF